MYHVEQYFLQKLDTDSFGKEGMESTFFKAITYTCE